MELAGLGLASGFFGPTGRRATELPSAQSSTLFAYVSSWTTGEGGAGDGGGIHVYTVDMADGSLTPVERIAEGINAGYICIAPSGRFLYVVDERKDRGGLSGAGGGVQAYVVDPDTGRLTLLNEQPSMGAFPCYISIDASGSRVIVANHASYDGTARLVEKNGTFKVETIYDDGTIALFPVRGDGSLGPACDVSVLEGSGPRAIFQMSPHPHSVVYDPSNRFALVCDKGADKILAYPIDVTGCALGSPVTFSTSPGVTPRHSAFHPHLPYVYIINEFSSSLSAYSFDPETGRLSAIQTLPTLPPAFTETNYCADIRVHPNGRFVYGSNRGHNSIVCFEIDQGSGKMKLIGFAPTQGSFPRAINIEPSGRFLFAANRESDNVVTFSIDADTGVISPTGAIASVGKPVCLRFFETREGLEER